MSENQNVTKAAGVVGGATLISRILGFLRDVFVAWYFGAGLSSDAFFVAFRIPNLLRRLFAEGSLTIAFVPVFTEVLTRSGRSEAFRLGRSTFRTLALLLWGVTLFGVLLAPWVVRVIAPGFTHSPEKFGLTVLLTRITFPYIFFVGLVALCMGILHPLGHFAAPAFAPVLLNVAMIGAVVWIAPHMTHPAAGLAIGVLIGGGLQLLLQIPFLLRQGFYFWQPTVWIHPALKRIGLLMLPAVFGAAVYQINILIGTLLASLLPEGSVSYLYYADRLVQFPLGIFGIAAATAVLPSLSRQAAAGDLEGFSDTFGHAMRLVFFITAPAMAGLIVLREPLVALLFQRGAFDREAVSMTASALLFYSVGLWAFSAVRIVVSSYYALQDTRTPVKMAAVAMAANLVFSLVLMRWLAHSGLALATSLASMLNYSLLLAGLKRKSGFPAAKPFTASTLRTAFCALAMGGVVWGGRQWLIPRDYADSAALAAGVAAAVFLGIVFYLGISYYCRSPEIETIKRLAGVRKNRQPPRR